MKKPCSKCKVPKEPDEFHTDNRLKCKRKAKCKSCYRKDLGKPEVRERRNKQSRVYSKRAKENLTDSFIIRQICHHNGLVPADIRKYPELIEAKRIQILTNRILKNEGKRKMCTKCKNVKSLDHFNKDYRLGQGYRSACKECCDKAIKPETIKRRRHRVVNYQKRIKEELTDAYIVRILTDKSGLKANDVRTFPELIKTQKTIEVIKKTIKHEKDNKRKNTPGKST